MEELDDFKRLVDSCNNLGKKRKMNGFINSKKYKVSDLKENINKVKTNKIRISILVWNMQTLNKEEKEDFKKRNFIRDWIARINPHIVFLIDMGTKVNEFSIPNYRLVHDGRNLFAIRFDVKNEEVYENRVFYLKDTDLNFTYCKPNEDKTLIEQIKSKLSNDRTIIGDLNLKSNPGLYKHVAGMSIFGENSNQTIVVKKKIRNAEVLNIDAPSDHKMVFFQITRRIKHTCQLAIKSFAFPETKRIIQDIFEKGEYKALISITQNKTLPTIDEEKYVCDKLVMDFLNNNTRSIFDRYKYIWKGFRREPFLGIYIPKKVEESLKGHYRHDNAKYYRDIKYNDSLTELTPSIFSKSTATNSDNMVLEDIDKTMRDIWINIKECGDEKKAIMNFIKFCNNTKNSMSYTTFFLRKNKVLESFNDIRIISIVPVQIKIWENLIYDRVTEYLTQIIDRKAIYQYGGRKGGSTYHALFKMQSKYYSYKAKGILFLDIQKGYDSIDWGILEKDICKLEDSKVKALLQTWFILVNNCDATCNGSPIKKTRGVGMGLSLAPIVFEWYVDQAFDEADFDRDICAMFVDDLCMLLFGESTELNKFERLSLCFKNRGLFINEKKSCILTKEIAISNTFDKIGICTKNKEKYLGINLELNNNNELISDDRYTQVSQIFMCLPKKLLFSVKKKIIEGALISRLRYSSMMYSLKYRVEKGQLFKLLWKAYKPSFFKLSYIQLFCLSCKFVSFFIDLFDLEKIKNDSNSWDDENERINFANEQLEGLCKTGIQQIDQGIKNTKIELEDPLTWNINLNLLRIITDKLNRAIMNNLIEIWWNEKRESKVLPSLEEINLVIKSKIFKNVKFVQDVIFQHFDNTAPDIVLFLKSIFNQLFVRLEQEKNILEDYVFVPLFVPVSNEINAWNKYLGTIYSELTACIINLINLGPKFNSEIYVLFALVDEVLNTRGIASLTCHDLVGVLNYKIKTREHYVKLVGEAINWNDYADYYTTIDDSPDDLDKTLSVDGSFANDIAGSGIILRYKNNEEKFVEEKYFIRLSKETSILRNVAGELCAVIAGINLGIKKGWNKINILFDYIGIPLYYKLVWSTDDKFIKTYREQLNKIISEAKIKINWLKVYSHTGVRLNDLADDLAKIGAGVKEPLEDSIEIPQPLCFS